ncbi:MAG: Hint domain-containing protein, partial [Polyangiaceae bacterium]|nr:Hint domain-containing protein [Polyangiaceae bacterium]
NVTNTAVHSTLDAKVIMTCFNGNDYVYSDLTAVETDEAQSYYLSKAFNWGEQYGAGVYYDDVAVASTIPSGKYHLIESFGFGSDTDTGDTAVYSQIVAFGAPQAPSLTLDHPREWNGGTPIRHCIKRGTFAGNGDCDYAGVDNTGVPTSAGQITGIAKMVYLANKWQADPNAWWKNIPNFSSTRIYVPISGTFDAGARPNMDCDIDPVNKFNADDTYARLIRKLEGGWCNAVGGVSQDFIKQIQIDPNDQRLGRFNYAADFGPDCLVNLQDVTLQVKVGAFTTCQQLPRASTEVTKEMDFRNSCLAAGTAVLRSDGKYVPVQDINIGDRVVANQRGVSLTVTSISRGGESEPMVRLYDNKGHDVMVTTKHPIVTPMGIVYADQVVEGMQVETEQGASTIIGVERVPYAGEVYNLTLGSDIELANIDELETTMIAGGILVGDNRMQFEMERRDTAERFAVGRNVPDDWRTDYENKRRAR